MKEFDLAIAHTWEYDKDFVDLIEKILQENGLSTFTVQFHNYEEVHFRIQTNELRFNHYLDRASDADDCFLPLAKLLTKKKTYIINNYSQVEIATDKATMHLEFISRGINTPFTIIISPFSKKNEIVLSVSELAKLGRPFIIKPANTTGGGLGVVTGAESLNDILRERQYLRDDKYLLQGRVLPLEMDNKRFWFRCFWAFGKVFPCWWDDVTHQYTVVTENEIERYDLKQLSRVIKKIQKICGLDFFSTEIALNEYGKFIVVDYVNEICDMRFQSKHFDGVPDEVVDGIVKALLKFIKSSRQAMV
ncbi:MAG: hypothetical protein FJ213_05325 [Ignavibacteria bacterium]|nr:hypothetical protein [Ignavibacteria bacterium]